MTETYGISWQQGSSDQVLANDYDDVTLANALKEMSKGELVKRLRGFPDRLSTLCDRFGELTVDDWYYLLYHRPNCNALVSKCNKWDQFRVEDLCDLFCRSPQLSSGCSAEIFKKFKRAHWARMIGAAHEFGRKLDELGLTESVAKGWCCQYHWAEEYNSIFDVRCAAATLEEDQIRQIATGSALNPNFDGLGRRTRFSNDKLAHLRWIASVAKDCAEMAEHAASSAALAVAEAERAALDEDDERAETAKKHAENVKVCTERYLLIAKAANYALHVYA